MTTLRAVRCALRMAETASAVSSCNMRAGSCVTSLGRPLSITAKAAAGKGKGGGGATAAVVETFDLSKQIPVNILKEGPEPEYKADSEYPPWLFELMAEKPPAEDLMMKGIENMTPAEMKVVIRTVSKRRIKDMNAVSTKSGEE